MTEDCCCIMAINVIMIQHSSLDNVKDCQLPSVTKLYNADVGGLPTHVNDGRLLLHNGYQCDHDSALKLGQREGLPASQCTALPFE